MSDEAQPELSAEKPRPPRLRRKLDCALLAALALVVLVLGIYAIRWSLPVPDLAARAKPMDVWKQRPIVYMPARDIDAGNHLVCVFVERGAEGDEISLVWADEDHPWPLCDEAYDLIRYGLYGRVMDVETYRWTPQGCELPRVFAGEQGFTTSVHESATLPRDAFRIEGGRPIIFVRTWNHMLHAAAGARDLRWVMVRDYPVYRGDRAAVEAVITE